MMLLGSLIEIGPIRINKDGTVREVEGSAWNEYASVLFGTLARRLEGTLNGQR
jgi:carboxypeptidase C (cathepsin A)